MTTKKQFLAETAKPAGQIDLERCALLFAAEMQPGLDIEASVLALDNQVDDFLAANADFHEAAPFNSKYLVAIMEKVLRYKGDSVEYYSPDNSLFNKVVENRLGIPISLAAAYISIGKRLGIDVHGVGFPGHFLIRIVEPDKSETFVDPFSHAIIGKAQLHAMREQAAARFGRFEERWLQNAHPHDILVRMLENLKAVYMHWSDFAAAATCLDFQLLLKPRDEVLLSQLQAFVDRTQGGKPGKPKLN